MLLVVVGFSACSQEHEPSEQSSPTGLTQPESGVETCDTEADDARRECLDRKFLQEVQTAGLQADSGDKRILQTARATCAYLESRSTAVTVNEVISAVSTNSDWPTHDIEKMISHLGIICSDGINNLSIESFVDGKEIQLIAKLSEGQPGEVSYTLPGGLGSDSVAIDDDWSKIVHYHAEDTRIVLQLRSAGAGNCAITADGEVVVEQSIRDGLATCSIGTGDK